MLKQPNTKEQFALRIKLWIHHKKIIAQHSPNYNQMTFLKSLRICSDLMKVVKRDCREYSMQSLSRLVLQNETHLRNILPFPKNPSYATQLEKLETLVLIAKNTLQHE